MTGYSGICGVRVCQCFHSLSASTVCYYTVLQISTFNTGRGKCLQWHRQSFRKLLRNLVARCMTVEKVINVNMEAKNTTGRKQHLKSFSSGSVWAGQVQQVYCQRWWWIEVYYVWQGGESTSQYSVAFWWLTLPTLNFAACLLSGLCQ